MDDLVERLRQSWNLPDAETCAKAADEIERLRSLLQNGSPVVEGTIQHMAMQLAACQKERDEAHAETDSVVYARDQAYEQLAACRKDAERYQFIRCGCSADVMYSLVDLHCEKFDAAIDAAMKEKQ